MDSRLKAAEREVEKAARKFDQAYEAADRAEINLNAAIKAKNLIQEEIARNG